LRLEGSCFEHSSSPQSHQLIGTPEDQIWTRQNYWGSFLSFGWKAERLKVIWKRKCLWLEPLNVHYKNKLLSSQTCVYSTYSYLVSCGDKSHCFHSTQHL
jgi:hypothetical protein